MKDNETNVFNTFFGVAKTECEDNKYSCPCAEKEKQIEEMTKEIQNAVDGCAEYWAKLIAKSLCDKGYRKLTENSVMLSREEYENIYEQAEQTVLANIVDGGTSCHWCIEKHEKKERKEMAEKILKEFDNIQENLSKKIKQLKEPFNYMSMNSDEKEGYKNGILVAKSIVTSFKSQFAKQLGVEIKES